MLFRPLVLLYHAVSDSWEDPLAVRASDFERQLRLLMGRGYRGGDARQILRRPGDRTLMHVTFDDGFASVSSVVPILQGLGLPCTIFVCTDLADRGDRLDIPELRNLPNAEERRTLGWSVLRDMAGDGLVEIASHTVTHAHLRQLSDEELKQEVADSKVAIEDHVGRPCQFIAYPYGEEDARVRRSVQRAGYTAGFASPGASLRIDPLRVPRTGFWRNESPIRVRMKTRFLLRVARENGMVPRRKYVSRPHSESLAAS